MIKDKTSLETLREQLALDSDTDAFLRGLQTLFASNQEIIADCTQRELKDLWLMRLITEAQYEAAANRHFACTIALNLPEVLRIEFVEEEDKRWSAIVLSLPGCAGSGTTRDEALQRVKEAANHHLSIRLEEILLEESDRTHREETDE